MCVATYAGIDAFRGYELVPFQAPLPRTHCMSVSASSSSPRLVLAALWLMMFSASSQVIIVSPILPNIARELSIPEAHLGWLVTIYAAMLGVFALIVGPISDKIGRRRIILIGCSAMAVTLLLHATATSFASLLTVRGLSGVAGGMLSGAAVSYVGDYFPYEKRGWAKRSSVAIGPCRISVSSSCQCCLLPA